MIDYDSIVASLNSSMKPINEFVDIKERKYKIKDKMSGLYVFWFNNIDGCIGKLKTELVIHGPDNIEQEIIWNWNLDNNNVCLYVGKSTDIKKRIGLHLLLGTNKLYEDNTAKKIYKKNTSSQLRSGFEYLYLKENNVNIFEEMEKRLKLSIFEENKFERRFYIEDYLVGKLLPWFNVDSER